MNKIKKKKMLFNPFERYSEKDLSIIGGISLLVGSLLGFFFNGHFDGALDLHFSHSVKPWEPFLENILSLICLVVVLFAVGKLLNSKTRLATILAVSLIARIPLYLLTFTNVYNSNYEIGQALFKSVVEPERNIPLDAIILSIGFNMVSLLAIIWMIALLFNGLKLATNTKGTKLVVGFIFALLIAETLSKCIFYFIY